MYSVFCLGPIFLEAELFTGRVTWLGKPGGMRSAWQLCNCAHYFVWAQSFWRPNYLRVVKPGWASGGIRFWRDEKCLVTVGSIFSFGASYFFWAQSYLEDDRETRVGANLFWRQEKCLATAGSLLSGPFHPFLSHSLEPACLPDRDQIRSG